MGFHLTSQGWRLLPMSPYFVTDKVLIIHNCLTEHHVKNDQTISLSPAPSMETSSILQLYNKIHIVCVFFYFFSSYFAAYWMFSYLFILTNLPYLVFMHVCVQGSRRDLKRPHLYCTDSGYKNPTGQFSCAFSSRHGAKAWSIRVHVCG